MGLKTVYRNDQLGGFDDPNLTANEDELRRRDAVVECLRVKADAKGRAEAITGFLAALLDCREHQVRNALWLAVWAGHLVYAITRDGDTTFEVRGA